MLVLSLEKKNNLIFKNTTDGTPTIKHPLFDQFLHSTHGSLQESEHIYIQSGLAFVKNKSSIDLLELGFGTGLNMFLSLIYAINHGIKINYTSLDMHPISNIILKEFWTIYLQKIEPFIKYQETINTLIDSDWEINIVINEHFNFIKKQTNFLDFKSNSRFDLCYYDAFDPVAQPELWDVDAMNHLATLMQKNGTVVSYCCKGMVKRNLKQAGFAIEKIPGPIGKREIIRAIKI